MLLQYPKGYLHREGRGDNQIRRWSCNQSKLEENDAFHITLLMICAWNSDLLRPEYFRFFTMYRYMCIPSCTVNLCLSKSADLWPLQPQPATSHSYSCTATDSPFLCPMFSPCISRKCLPSKYLVVNLELHHVTLHAIDFASFFSCWLFSHRWYWRGCFAFQCWTCMPLLEYGPYLHRRIPHGYCPVR